MTDNTFDVWKRPGNRLIVRGNGFGGTYSPYGEYSWLANRADLPADAVLLTPESKGLEPLRAVNRRMHDRILEDEIALEALRGELAEAKRTHIQHITWLNGDCDDCTLSARMRAAADVLEEAASHMDMRWPNLTFAAEWSPEALRTQADVFEVEDRERAETEQKVDEVANVIRRSDTMTDPKVGTRVADVYAARALLAEYDMTPKVVGE